MPGRFAEIVSIEIAHADCRALVALRDDRAADPFDHFSGLRANFLAHLIATRDRLPQTTVLRRESRSRGCRVSARAWGTRRDKIPAGLSARGCNKTVHLTLPLP